MRYSYEARCRAVDAMLAGVSPRDAAASAGASASRASGYRWWARYRAGGWAAAGRRLGERPSTPKRQPRRLSTAEEAEIVAARERSGAGPLTLGAMLGRPASTVGKVLRRLGRSRLPREPRPPMVRHERERPGELLHIDTKKLGRFWNVGKRILNDGVTRSPRAGWQHVHVASRLAYAEVLPTDRRHDALAFLERTLHWFAEQGVTVEAVMTDNGAAYASHVRWSRCDELGLHHPRTRPYTPRTNGKAERFIQMLLRSWAYAFAYPTSARRKRGPSQGGRGGTTGAVPTARSAASRPSAVSHTSLWSVHLIRRVTPRSRSPYGHTRSGTRDARFPSSAGIHPLSSFELSARCLSAARFPSSGGRGPRKPLPTSRGRVTRPAPLVDTPYHSSIGRPDSHLCALVQDLPPLASKSATSTARSRDGPRTVVDGHGAPLAYPRAAGVAISVGAGSTTNASPSPPRAAQAAITMITTASAAARTVAAPTARVDIVAPALPPTPVRVGPSPRWYRAAERLHALPRWLYRYNVRRPHGGIGGAVPASRL